MPVGFSYEIFSERQVPSVSYDKIHKKQNFIEISKRKKEYILEKIGGGGGSDRPERDVL